MNDKIIMAVSLLAAAFSANATLNDGDAIAYFPFDSDYLSCVNTECNPASAVTYTQSGGRISFESSCPGAYVVANGTPRANGGHLVVSQGRAFIDLSQFETGEEMKSATIEFFFKSSTEVNWGCKVALMKASAASVDDNARPYLLYLQRHDKTGKLVPRADAVNHNGTDSLGVNYVNFTDNSTGFDGEWHHVAMTISPLYSSDSVHTGSVISCYFDYGGAITRSMANPWRGFAADGDNKLYLSVGERNSTVAVDEFRITKGVLPKNRFLIQRDSVPQNGDALVYMKFEGNLDSSADCVAADKPTIMDNAVPAYSTDVKRDKITSWDGNDILNDANIRCFDVTKVIRFNLPYWALGYNALDSATIEFLMKGTAKAEDWMTTLKLGNSSEPVLFLVQLNSANPRQFVFRSDAWSGNAWDKVQYTIPSAKGVFADEKWHHFAMTAEPDGTGHSTIKFYFDYECVNTATTANYPWRGIDPDNMFLYMGRTGQHNDCEALIDEIRISKGVLPKEKFLRYGKTGLVISYR